VYVSAVGGPDCNDNYIPNICDILDGSSEDLDVDGIPDECQDECAEDIIGDGVVDVLDLLALLAAWGRVEKKGRRDDVTERCSEPRRSRRGNLGARDAIAPNCLCACDGQRAGGANRDSPAPAASPRRLASSDKARGNQSPLPFPGLGESWVRGIEA